MTFFASYVLPLWGVKHDDADTAHSSLAENVTAAISIARHMIAACPARFMFVSSRLFLYNLSVFI
jgi:hypothetical protein